MFSENAIKVLEKRYLLRDQEGRIAETPEELVERVAQCVAAVEPGDSSNDERAQELAASFKSMMISRSSCPIRRLS